MARTSRHGNPYKPVTDFSGSRPDTLTSDQSDQRYLRLKKRSVLLLLVAICAAIAYVLFVLVGSLALPAVTPVAVQVIVTIVIALSLATAVISGVAALIVRLIAALKK